ncbi:putative formate/nitrite transporter [Roridomyces roridus]|uniref:Formate/nitrite transporter n=1 Tax=Roridomyces roridus TaxID=1738132 RepID=A0AAD7G0F1_9AGAR|nr:putative formate/nitrite transporter [Roridomyces roridus]
MERSTLPPAEVAVVFLKQALVKHRERYDVIFFKAFSAGVMLSFSGLLSEVMSGGSPGLTASNPGLVKVLGGFVFPVGLVMIVLQGLELLTSNMLILPMAVAKGVIPWWSLPLNWLIVTFGNLVGCLFFAALLVRYSGILDAEPYHAYVISFATKKAELEWHQIFLRAIGCNWLVAVAIWQSTAAKETMSKILAIWLPIWLFIACSFEHIVANMFSIPLAIMFHAPGVFTDRLSRSLIATFVGNMVGALFVALPAVHWYLRDYDVGGLRNAEAGESEASLRDAGSDNNSEVKTK